MPVMQWLESKQKWLVAAEDLQLYQNDKKRHENKVIVLHKSTNTKVTNGIHLQHRIQIIYGEARVNGADNEEIATMRRNG